MGGKVHRLESDPRFQHRLLDRIRGVSLAFEHSHPIIRLETDAKHLQLDWLCRQVVFRFTIDGGAKILEAPYRHIMHLEVSPPYYIEVGPLRNTQTGQFEAGVGEWQTLTIAIIAGGEEKNFKVSKAP